MGTKLPPVSSVIHPKNVLTFGIFIFVYCFVRAKTVSVEKKFKYNMVKDICSR